jgi:hypothetical protein
MIRAFGLPIRGAYSAARNCLMIGMPPGNPGLSGE